MWYSNISYKRQKVWRFWWAFRIVRKLNLSVEYQAGWGFEKMVYLYIEIAWEILRC